MKLAAACASMEVKAKPARGGKRTRASVGTAGTPTEKLLMEKKDSEKERRQRMKALCDKLASLIPKEDNPHADTVTQLGSLDVAASYIKKLKERVDELQRKKASMQAMATSRGVNDIRTPTTTTNTSSGCGSLEGEKYLEASPTVVEVRQSDESSMEVRLICSTKRPIKLHEVITIHEEEGADIVNANHSVAGHKIFYTIHSRAFSTRIGIDVSRINERLRALDVVAATTISMDKKGGNNHCQYSNCDNGGCSCLQRSSKMGPPSLKGSKLLDHIFEDNDNQPPNYTTTYDIDTNSYAGKGAWTT
ncbi:uncharacterized protein LOC119274232 [Triticum dicoccoides]|uniref:uncharacterized protein LOC119274232 n=1 Tax=Triticum dicoccoides TaxID=85692 RepID=UPI0018909154|nr:uncharacterized protein LOC119274232 [Triticum dicoccoides]